MAEQKLKSCPFCGGEAKAFFSPESNVIECSDCIVSTWEYKTAEAKECKTKAEAITAWNTRHHDLTESNYLKVLFDGSKTHDSGCIVWQKRCSNRGYGEISYLGNKSLTHRVMYELINGPVPEGKCVCHTCDNPPCINPTHLFLGTQSDNMQDCVKKGRCYNPRGEAHPSAKLTEMQAQKIKSSPLLTSILAKDYGVSIGTIRSIKRGTTWKHLSCTENPLLEVLEKTLPFIDEHRKNCLDFAKDSAHKGNRDNQKFWELETKAIVKLLDEIKAIAQAKEQVKC